MVSNRPSKLSESELQKAAPQPFGKDELALSTGVLGAPIAWALQLALSYGLIYPAERWQSKSVLHVVTALAIVPALASLLLGWRALRRAARGLPAAAEERERTHFLGACACGVGIFFLLAILAQSIPTFMLSLRSR